MTNKEREQTLLEYYKDIQNFIDKLTLTAALGSIPLALGYVDKVLKFGFLGKFLFVAVNIFAAAVVVAHIIGAIYGKKSCDAALANEKNAEKYGEIQEKFNKSVNWNFICMIIGYLLIIIYLTCGGQYEI
mgnify:CR=1 FL=1